MTASSVAWFKSSYSDEHTNCVEVAHHPTPDPSRVAVRDSRHPEQVVLTVSTHEWRAFLTQIKHTE